MLHLFYTVERMSKMTDIIELRAQVSIGQIPMLTLTLIFYTLLIRNGIRRLKQCAVVT
jgi:hypothetical protein